MTKPKKKQPHPVDVHIGKGICTRRMLLGISQEKLGATVGVTFQQIQKYEKGENRVGSSRLAEIANTLKCSPGLFFEGAPGLKNIKQTDDIEGLSLLAIPGAVDLLKAFEGCSRNGQQSLINIAQQVAA
ncbi:transcriptional regulator [Pseudovibrio japonicus]|uniref:Transcriptional regulator n=1 Tax=Pseudovibrio japonicus TaxID=366534 RepID=A0ABQ3ECX8_9HYPH|nr:helix-turn-helix transcriptional regulator [Pseudovibrio japonicus]GHB33793.1 transcriptional regulator [Pseudovibrio japonicus]